jgi:hypothetical protein
MRKLQFVSKIAIFDDSFIGEKDFNKITYKSLSDIKSLPLIVDLEEPVFVKAKANSDVTKVILYVEQPDHFKIYVGLFVKEGVEMSLKDYGEMYEYYSSSKGDIKKAKDYFNFLVDLYDCKKDIKIPGFSSLNFT